MSLFINRNFALLWLGQTVSRLGDYVFDTTLILWIAADIARGQAWAPLAVSGVLVATSIPIFATGPIAGVFADRWDKRSTMLRMDGLRAVLIALLLLALLPFVAADHRGIFWQLGLMYGIVFLASICSQFFNPSSLALLADIVEEPERARATGLTQMMASLAMIAGPPLATLLFFTVGVQWAILLNALSFVFSFLTILAVRVPRATTSVESREQDSFFHEFSEGIRFYVSNQVLMAILITGVLIMFYEGSNSALGVFFVPQNLHAPISFYGFLGTALGVGLTVGAALAALFAQRIGVVRTFWSSIVISGMLMLLYARMTSFVPGLVVTFLLGLSIAATNVAVAPLLLHATPRELIGRVSAVLNPVMILASMLSVILAGYLDSVVLHGLHLTLFGLIIGPIDTIFTLAGLLTVASGLFAMRSLRDVKLDQKQEVVKAPA